MAEDQRNARIFGVLFLITFITSIPALALYQPVLDDPTGYIAGAGEDNQIYLGALLEVGQHGARDHGDPGVPVGALARRLCGRLGIQARCSEPEG